MIVKTRLHSDGWSKILTLPRAAVKRWRIGRKTKAFAQFRGPDNAPEKIVVSLDEVQELDFGGEGTIWMRGKTKQCSVLLPQSVEVGLLYAVEVGETEAIYRLRGSEK